MSVFFINNAATTSAPDSIDAETKPEVAGGDEQNQTQSEAQAELLLFWAKVLEEIKAIGTMDLKQQVLPLARIKKIMKLDEDVKMISAEAPLLFAKAAEIFVHELTLRSWIHTEDNKRRTLQRNDIAMAITKFDQFDFLIDIVPRDDIKPVSKPKEEGGQPRATLNSDQVQYYLQLAQQHHASLQQNSTAQSTATTTTSPTQAQNTIQIVPSQQVQTVHTVNSLEHNTAGTSTANANQTPVLLQNAVAPSSPTQNQPGNIQIVQQIVTATGEIQQIPIQLSPQQLQMIRMQLQNNTNQPLIIQAAPIQTSQPQIIQVAQPNTSGQQVFLTQSNGSTESE